jgi:hypothetical protein
MGIRTDFVLVLVVLLEEVVVFVVEVVFFVVEVVVFVVLYKLLCQYCLIKGDEFQTKFHDV